MPGAEATSPEDNVRQNITKRQKDKKKKGQKDKKAKIWKSWKWGKSEFCDISVKLLPSLNWVCYIL